MALSPGSEIDLFLSAKITTGELRKMSQKMLIIWPQLPAASGNLRRSQKDNNRSRLLQQPKPTLLMNKAASFSK